MSVETKTPLNERAAVEPTSGRQNSVRRDVARRQPANKGNAVEFDPKLLWVTFRRCWLWATPIGLALAATAAYAVYATFVPVYQATHLLEANNDYVVFRGVMPESRNLAATEKQLIFTDLVLDAVLSDPEVQSAAGFDEMEFAKYELREKLSIGNAGSKELLTISYEHSDPAAAALICNKVTEAYLAQRTRFDNERVSNLESWLSPSIDLWKAEVQTHEKRVRELSKTSLGYDPTVRVEGVENDLTILSSLRRDLANLVVEESILEAKVAMHDSDAPIAPDPASLPEIKIPEPTAAEIQRFVDSDRDVQHERGILTQREAAVRSMEERDLARVRQEFFRGLQEGVKEQLVIVKQVEQEARDRAPEELRRHARELAERNRAAQLAQAVVRAKTEREAQRAQLAEVKAKRAIIQQEYDVEKARLEQQGGNAADLRFAQEDREIAAGILTQLNERQAAIRTEQRRGSGVHTLAAATPPSKPVEPMPTKKMLVAGAGAFAIPFLLGLLWEFRSQRICDAGTLESKDLAPIVGEVARLPSKITAGSRGRRVFEESIDTLRANLMLSKETRGVRSIAVASSMSGEGKSSVASQLAISLAKACGKTVLLVDCDLRSPDQHDIFGLPMGPGLTKVLAGEATLEEAIDTSLGDLVHVLPAGQMLMSPHRLLNASALRDTLDQAMHKYAYVVVDTAPVLAAGETLAVASETDATLLCVMRDVSRSDTVVRSNRRLEAAGANVVGTVFSGVPYHQYAYRYGDYRYLTPAENA